MPKITVSITRKRTIEEMGDIEIDVPQSVIDGDEDLLEWVAANVKHDELDAVMDGGWEDEDIIDATHV